MFTGSPAYKFAKIAIILLIRTTNLQREPHGFVKAESFLSDMVKLDWQCFQD